MCHSLQRVTRGAYSSLCFLFASASLPSRPPRRATLFSTQSQKKTSFVSNFFLYFFFLYVQAASKPTAARDIAEHTMSILNEALAVPLRTPRTARDASRLAGVV